MKRSLALTLTLVSSAAAMAQVHVTDRLNLLGIEMCDQELRQRMSTFIQTCSPMPEALHNEKAMRETMHMSVLKSVMRHGFPTISRVGLDGSHAAFTIALHSTDHRFQADFLKQAERWAKKGEVHPWDHAAMFDRVRLNQGKKQCFGMHFHLSANCMPVLSPTEPMVAVNRRRIKIGLPTVQESMRKAEVMVKNGRWHMAERWNLNEILADNGESR
ncbi:MAG: hypothetical protein MH204_12095 [Fimbriimonadaceae bacterium]|nr:hypothetical protein [Fimbriimonadaceae bacterium]